MFLFNKPGVGEDFKGSDAGRQCVSFSCMIFICIHGNFNSILVVFLKFKNMQILFKAQKYSIQCFCNNDLSLDNMSYRIIQLNSHLA